MLLLTQPNIFTKHSADINSNTFHASDTKSILHFQTMALLKEVKFSRSTRLTETHSVIQGQAGNATWVSEFKHVVRGGEKLVDEELLWPCYNIQLCCAIVGDFAMYIGGKLGSPHNLLTI
jgi:hypothetical protein